MSSPPNATTGAGHGSVLAATLVVVVTLVLGALAVMPAGAQTAAPVADPPAHGLRADRLAVIVNDADPLSVRIGAYYRARRGIPGQNMLHVSFDVPADTMSRKRFRRVKARVDALTPPGIQAYALTWVKPYRVDCMSVTTAFAAGFDARFCAKGCKPTAHSAYYGAGSTTPFDDFGIRPTMSIAALDFERAKALIDRGVAADGTRPQGRGYLVETAERRRNIRAGGFPAVLASLGDRVGLSHVTNGYLEGRRDVLFYFTGGARIPALDSNGFLPGAVGDHLTSGGGKLTRDKQMSALRWLEAGATGSYGTVVEPCNFLGKFPDPGRFIERYTAGETLVEAYWKSVAMPGQGIFIGEPLARPFGATRPMSAASAVRAN